MSWRLEEKRDDDRALGSTLTQAHIAIDDNGPSSQSQNPPAGVARLPEHPQQDRAEQGAMKKLNSAGRNP